MYYTALTANNVLLTLKKTRFIFITSLMGAGSNVLFNLYMIPKYGFLGAALTTLFSQALMATLLFIRARQLLQTPTPWHDYLKIAVAALASGLLAYLVSSLLSSVNHLVQFILTLGTLAICYAAFLLAMKYVREEEKIVLRYIREKYHLKIPFLERLLR